MFRPIFQARSVFFGMLLFAAVGLCVLFSVARAQNTTNPDAACVDSLYQLSTGISQYVQDYDEVFPPMADSGQLRTAVTPYVRNASVFDCPATGVPYQPNSSLSQRSCRSISGDSAKVPVVQDQQVHPDGLSTVSFLDGHVEQGGVPVTRGGAPQTTDERCFHNARQVNIALVQYIQDNDETYPPMQTASQFQTAVSPYVSSPSEFDCPDTGYNYQPNGDLSERSLADIADPATTLDFQDPVAHADGLVTSAFADGHVVQDHRGPTLLILTDLSFQSKIVYGGQVAVGTVRLSCPAPSGGKTVTLASSQPMSLSVPPSVFVAEGNVSAQFSARTSPSLRDVQCTVTAHLASSDRTAVLSVQRTRLKSVPRLDLSKS